METKEERLLKNSIETEILNVASLYNEVDTSDLQGLAMVAAEKIIKLVKESAK